MLATSLNSFAISIISILIILLITAAMHAIMHQLGRPLLLGTIFAAIIITSLHLPKSYFDINNIGIIGEFGLNLYIMLIASQFDYQVLVRQKQILILPFISMIIMIIIGFIASPFLFKFNNNQLDYSIFSLMIGLLLSSTSMSLIVLFIHESNLDTHPIGHIGLLLTTLEDLIFTSFYVVFFNKIQHNSIPSTTNKTYLIIILLIIVLSPILIKNIAKLIKSNLAMLYFILCGTLIACLVAYIANVHLSLGALLFGLMLPRKNHLIQNIMSKSSDLLKIVFIPIFFVFFTNSLFTHLNLNLHILSIGIITAFIVFVTKFALIYLTGKTFYHYSNAKSIFLGSLLNLRGISQIIIIQTCFEMKLISTSIFTIFYITATITTFAATSLMFYCRRFIK